MIGWLRARREARLLRERAIPDALWQATLTQFPFLRLARADEAARLRELATLFLADKEFSAAGGLMLTDAMAVAVAAQACLPVLNFGLAPYAGFVGIVMHPAEVTARREWTDEHGIVHAWDEVLAGEAMEGGPIMLSWRDVEAAGTDAEGRPYNVVIHEFVHVLDMGNGAIDGLPALPDPALRRHWRQVLEAGRAQLQRALDAGRPGVLDPYGASSVEEFFPVAAEAFFLNPEALRDEAPPVFDLLAQYFLQGPELASAR